MSKENNENREIAGVEELAFKSNKSVFFKRLGYFLAVMIILSGCKNEDPGWDPIKKGRNWLPEIEKVKKDTIYFKVEILNAKTLVEPVIDSYVGTMDGFRRENSIRGEFKDKDGNVVFEVLKPLNWNSHVLENANDENSLIYRYTKTEKDK